MPQIEAISLDRAAALEGLSKEALKKRLKRRSILGMKDPNHRQRKFVPITALSPAAYTQWMKDQARCALIPPEPEHPAAGNNTAELQPILPFAPPTKTERELCAAAPPAIPGNHQAYIKRWAAIVGDCKNGTWHKYRGTLFQGFAISNNRDFIRALAHQHNIGVSTIYQKLKLLEEVNRDADIPRDRKTVEFWQRILPRNRPGRSGYSFFNEPENLWMGQKLLSFYLTQAKHSVKRAHQLLLAEIESKQKACGAAHLYQKPTVYQSRTLLGKLDLATRTLARGGEKAYQDRCAPYISRRNNLHANHLWVTDQKLYDVRLRDGGERLGRVWGVNVMDVATWRWLGGAVGPFLSSDLVMYAYAMALARAGVPRAIHIDLGKEFTGKRFLGGVRTISGAALFGEAAGMWDRLGVHIVKANGRNPQSKVIERWHREIDRWTQEVPGWCGSNPSERPEKLAREEAEHKIWLSSGQGRSPLMKAQVFIAEFFNWAENRWNAAHRGRGKYLQGMTPNEAWNTRLPAEGLRRLTSAEVDHYTADRRFVKVARGGQINLTFYGQTIEYLAPELFALQGEEVEVLVGRSNLQRVTVNFPVTGGMDSCTAERKPQLEWLPEDREELKLAMRCRAAVRRALKRGIEASCALADADNPIDLIAGAQNQKSLAPGFGMPALPARPRREKPRFANERAAAVLATLDEQESL